jgi:hypothetical protein
MPWPSRRQAVSAAVGLLDPRVGDDLMAWSDPLPGLAQLGTIVRDALRDQRRPDG